jgi:hypothetical protein
MITPYDQDMIIAMVGPEYAQNPPEDFVVEYATRLGMVSRGGGNFQGLGVIGVMQLLRDFKVEPKKKPQLIAVSDWSRVDKDTPVMYQGRRGVYQGPSGEGHILIRMDGYRASIEVPRKDVTLTKPIVEDVDDKVFQKDPDDAPPPRAALLEPDPVEEKQSDELLDAWGNVEAGSAVIAQWRGKDVEAEFVDIDGDNDIVVLINGAKRKLDSSKVKVQINA